MSTPKNPSAFPEVFTTSPSDSDPDARYEPDVHSCGGMSLRDYFAAKAMPEILHFQAGDSSTGKTNYEFVAEICYRLADAMLAERAKAKPQ